MGDDVKCKMGDDVKCKMGWNVKCKMGCDVKCEMGLRGSEKHNRFCEKLKMFSYTVFKEEQCAIVERALSVRHGGALEQSPESKCRTCRLHKTGRPIIARICSSIENNKIWWVGKQYNIHAFPNIEESENLLRENFSDANAAPPRIMLPVKSQIKLKLCKYQEENFSISCSLMEMLLSKE